MTVPHDCESCSVSGGCTSRRTEEKDAEEISAGVYLVLCGVIIVLASLVVRWLL